MDSNSSPASDWKTVTLRDGRSLGYAEYGDPDGQPVFHFHGHPGSRLEAALLARIAPKVGVRLIGTDRPGMGLSHFKPGRSILDWPDDVTQLADVLGISRFAVEGISGGGPYAAACAYKIPERLTACGIVAGVGPIDLLGTRGMMLAKRVQFFISRRLPWVLRFALWVALGRHTRYSQNATRLEQLSSRVVAGLSAPDREVMADLELRRLYGLELLEAFRQGSAGPAYDATLYAQPWGFRLGDITLDNVHLWHGELDVHVPIIMARAVAGAIPNCQTRVYPNDAHLSVAFNHGDEIFQAMVS